MQSTSAPVAELREQHSALWEAINSPAAAVLTDREDNTLLMAFGLLDGRRCSLNTMGCVYGVTRERIRQYARAGLTKLGLSGLRLPVFPRGWDEDPQRETIVYDREYQALLARRASARPAGDPRMVDLDAGTAQLR